MPSVGRHDKAAILPVAQRDKAEMRFAKGLELLAREPGMAPMPLAKHYAMQTVDGRGLRPRARTLTLTAAASGSMPVATALA